MPLTLTIATLRERDVCNLDLRVRDLYAALGRTVGDAEPIPLRVWWGLPSTTFEDRWWSLSAAQPPLDAQILGVRAACRAAGRVLSSDRDEISVIFVAEAAITAAEAWAEAPTPENAVRAERAAIITLTACTMFPYRSYFAACAAGNAARATRQPFYVVPLTQAAANAIYATDANEPEREAQRHDLDELLAALDSP